MNKKEQTIKEKLLELFNLTKKEAFLDVKTQDGSILRTPDDTLKVSSQVTLVGADGTESPAPDGDITLSDGSTATIKSGVVEAITPAPTVDPATAAPAADATTTPATNMADSQVDAPVDGTPAPAADAATPAADSDDMSKLLEIIKNITDRLSALEEKLGETKMAVTKMAAAPAAAPFNKTGKKLNPFQAFKENAVAKEKREHDKKLAFAKIGSEVKRDVPQVFTKVDPKSTTPNVAPIKPSNKKFDLGMPMGGSLSN